MGVGHPQQRGRGSGRAQGLSTQSITVPQGICHLCARQVPGQSGFEGDGAVRHGGKLHAAGAVVQQVKVGVVSLDEADRPVDAAVVIEVASGWDPAPVARVVSQDQQFVFARAGRAGRIQAKAGISALVLPQALAVEPDLGQAAYRLEAEKQRPAGPGASRKVQR